MSIRGIFKNVRKYFGKLAQNVNEHDGALSHSDWFMYSANVSPSTIGQLCIYVNEYLRLYIFTQQY